MSHDGTTKRAQVLVVDGDARFRAGLVRQLAEAGFGVAEAADETTGIETYRNGPFELVIVAAKGPSLDGLRLIREIQDAAPETVGILIAEENAATGAREAMRQGAFDYLAKPIVFDKLLVVIERALGFQRLRHESVALCDPLVGQGGFDNIVGESRAMRAVFRMIEKVADTDSTVLVQGDSGTGKELVARALHYRSRRRDRYLIPVNCGAIPENLLESELFGHVKGAFTGATTNRIGRFEAANGGTLFLDEIGDMSPSLQVKLLRVLQNQEFEPVGSTKTRKVDVRIIAATNRRLEEMVADGGFREDLYYRLSVIPIHIAPLRERVEDIPLLATHFLDRFSRQKKRKLKPLSPDVMDALVRYEWPGNVRELENLIERLVILAESDRILLDDLPEKFTRDVTAGRAGEVVIPEDGIDFNQVVGDYEDRLITAAMEKAAGNKNRAAQLLNLKRTTLVEKIKKKGLAFDD